jgi:hypothetical protein
LGAQFPANQGNDHKLSVASFQFSFCTDPRRRVPRQRRKQAEFLVHRFCPWGLIEEIGVLDSIAQARVREILDRSGSGPHPPVNVRADWYY